MRLFWTEGATADLENIANFLFEKTPLHAARLVRRIYEGPRQIVSFPESGREGRKAGTRELPILPLPYLIVYQISGEVIYIVRICMGSKLGRRGHLLLGAKGTGVPLTARELGTYAGVTKVI